MVGQWKCRRSENGTNRTCCQISIVPLLDTAVCCSSDVQLRSKATESEGKSPSWPAPCDTATRLTSRLGCSARNSGKNEHILVAFLTVKKANTLLSQIFLLLVRREEECQELSFMKKKTQKSAVKTSTHLSNRAHWCCWCVFTPACMSQSARANSSASSWEYL